MRQTQIQTELQEIKKLISTQAEKPLDFNEASKYLNISKSYLYKLTSGCKIPFYKPFGKKIYFDKAMLNEWVYRNLKKSNDQIEAEAEKYLTK